MFDGWENFYLIVGPSAAALIGLMFVVITLTADNEPRGMERGAAVYITPIVFHLAVVLVLSAVTMAPALPGEVLAGVLTVLGLFGVVYAVLTLVRFMGLKLANLYVPDLSDRIFYGVLPALAYAALIGAGALVLSDAEAAPYVLGAVTLAVLLIGIRNAWDLVTAIVRTLAKRRHPK